MIEQKNWKIMKIIFSTIFCLTSIRKERVGKKYHIIFFFNILKKMEMENESHKNSFLKRKIFYSNPNPFTFQKKI